MRCQCDIVRVVLSKCRCYTVLVGFRSFARRLLCLAILVLAGACGETAREPGATSGANSDTAAANASTGHPLSIGGLVASGMGGSSAGGGAATQSASSIGGQSSQTIGGSTATGSVGGSVSSGGQAGAPGSATTGAGGEPSCESFGCTPGGNVGVECGLEEPGVVWVCTSEPWGLGPESHRCIDMATQVPRYCCPLDFRPECL